MKNVTELIEAIRLKTGMSPRDFSFSLGLSQSASYQWTKENAKPSQGAVERIVLMYGEYAPEECAQLQALSATLYKSSPRFAKGAKHKQNRTYTQKYRNEEPICTIHCGIYDVMVHDWGRTYRGKQLVLNCFYDDNNGHTARYGYRYSHVQKDSNGYFFIRKGIKFYFCDAQNVQEQFKTVFD